MREAFSLNREFDFVRLEGLRRSTGRPSHEWDLYIVKELIDNALDADDALWHDDPAQFPQVQVRIEYIPVPRQQSQQLFIQVINRAAFPVQQIVDIFATGWYTSRKAFVRGLSRGALGNALKTLLGIPYALRARVTGDWSPDLKPLSLLCKGTEYLPRYVVDTTAQAIRFECDTKNAKQTESTAVSIGLDHFVQEMPRSLVQIELLAQQYHLCNPQAEFHWVIEIGEQEHSIKFAPNLDWSGKFQGTAPIQWYSPTAFHDLLGALYRKRFGGDESRKLSVDAIYQCFTECNGDHTPSGQSPALEIATLLGRSELQKRELEGPIASRLYRILCQHSPPFDSRRLGCIGPEHIRAILADSLPIDGEVLYEIASDSGEDPNVPFVIEVAVAHLSPPDDGGRRQIWTAINFTPTYDDPFLSRWLRAPIRPDEPVLGLRGFLDAYDIREDTPVVMFLHLVCPNVEHGEFSKTEINHLPFKQVLGDLLDGLLGALRQAREDEEHRLEQSVFQMLDAILSELDSEERFVFDQLVERLRAKLRKEPELSAWLEMPDALGRLRTYIANYQSQNAVLSHHVARPAPGLLSIPAHPNNHYDMLVEQVSRELLNQQHINKILYVQARELEPVVIENNWLCRMDLALLRNPPASPGLREAILQCAINSEVPILVLHNADEADRAIVEHIRGWLREKQLDVRRIVDLGLYAQEEQGVGSQPTKLVEMMPGELAEWVQARLTALDIPTKAVPSDTDVRQAIGERFERLLLGHLWEGISQHIEVPHLLKDLDSQLQFTHTMIASALDQQLRNRIEQAPCDESYKMALEGVVGEFFQDFMRDHQAVMREMVLAHLVEVCKGW